MLKRIAKILPFFLNVKGSGIIMKNKVGYDKKQTQW